ncbi:hypothetical protein [Nocardia jinanensis]|uniref:Uncharacterized protein n=1 Tax=Nocardia jinanensis TaxID=382504 RepID=A0A917RSV3_9NOCA|nr:hypothetical protein [Nocardia jinanensis]GGL27300.1 hypothetical protein GCM10011588_47600 [Nocardia jinanensis]
MATGVGLHIAEYACTAAVVDDDDGEPHFILREPVLHMSEEGDAVLGGAVAPPGHTHTITGFVAAVGDPAGVVVDDGEAYRGEDLLATALFCLINLTADHLNGPAEFYATHPAGWPAAQVLALRGALDYLGLKSVTLIGEDELPAQPGGLTPAETARYFAEIAGRAALAVVLQTPAGATPPDPTTAQNSALDTVVMPKLRDTSANKAYSAMVPAMDPEATYGGPSLGAIAAGLGPAAEPAPATGARPATGTAAALSASAAAKPTAIPAAAGPPRRDRSSGGARRTAALVAAAAVGGLLIGALGVTAVLRPGAAEPGEPAATSVTETPQAPPPVQPQPVAPLPETPAYTPEPTYDPEPTYTEESTVAPPPPVTATETIPEPTTVPPTGTGEPTGPTLTEPTTESETTTTRTRPRFFPFPVPFRTEDPDVDLPDTGSQEGGQEEAR